MHSLRSVVAPLAGIARHSLVLALSCLSLGATTRRRRRTRAHAGARHPVAPPGMRLTAAGGASAVGAALLLGAGPAHAQGDLVASATALGPVADPVRCANGRVADIAFPVGSVSISCSGGVGIYQAAASNVAGVSRASSSAISTGAAGEFARGGGAMGNAFWSDVLRFTGAVTPAAAVFRLHLEGEVRTFTEAGDPGGAQATSSFQMGGNVVGRSAVPDVLRQYQSSVFGFGDGPKAETIRVDELLTLTVPIVGAVAPQGLAFFWTLTTRAAFGSLAPTGSAAGYAINDFSDTAVLTALRFLDASGGDVTSSVAYTFDNGTRIVPTATVPEPGTWALLASGLLGLGAITRRRRARG